MKHKANAASAKMNWNKKENAPITKGRWAPHARDTAT